MDDASAVRRFDLLALSPSERLDLLQPDKGERADMHDDVRNAITAVRDGGDDVLCRTAAARHGVDLDPSEIQIDNGDFVRAFERLDPEVTRRLDETVNRLRDFHEAEMPQELWLKQVRPGQWAGHRHRPIDAVACYVPDGSDVLAEAGVMNAIPALIAGVPRVVLVTPPEPDGGISDLVLVAAATVGVGEIYKLDPVSAAAALAFGTERLPKVGKLMAPYSAPLSAARRVLAPDLEIDLAGGAGRAVLLADEWAHADAVREGAMAMADRVEGGSATLLSPSVDLLDAVAERWAGACPCDAILAPSMAAALKLINQADPGHLSVFAADPMAVLSSVDISGEIDLRGAHTASLFSPVDRTDVPGPATRCRASFSVFDCLQRIAINYPTVAIAIDDEQPAKTAAVDSALLGQL